MVEDKHALLFRLALRTFEMSHWLSGSFSVRHHGVDFIALPNLGDGKRGEKLLVEQII